MSNVYVDTCFCFHVYAQILLFMGVNDNVCFFDNLTLLCDWTNHRTGFQLKILKPCLIVYFLTTPTSEQEVVAGFSELLAHRAVDQKVGTGVENE